MWSVRKGAITTSIISEKNSYAMQAFYGGPVK